VLHSESGQPGGTVTVVVLAFPERGPGGSRGQRLGAQHPGGQVRVFRTDGHSLFLVEQLADNWGYTRDTVGSTVWFRLTC
jgi:hypothetical protein